MCLYRIWVTLNCYRSVFNIVYTPFSVQVHWLKGWHLCSAICCQFFKNICGKSGCLVRPADVCKTDCVKLMISFIGAWYKCTIVRGIITRKHISNANLFKFGQWHYRNTSKPSAATYLTINGMIILYMSSDSPIWGCTDSVLTVAYRIRCSSSDGDPLPNHKLQRISGK